MLVAAFKNDNKSMILINIPSVVAPVLLTSDLQRGKGRRAIDSWTPNTSLQFVVVRCKVWLSQSRLCCKFFQVDEDFVQDMNYVRWEDYLLLAR